MGACVTAALGHSVESASAARRQWAFPPLPGAAERSHMTTNTALLPLPAPLSRVDLYLRTSPMRPRGRRVDDRSRGLRRRLLGLHQLQEVTASRARAPRGPSGAGRRCGPQSRETPPPANTCHSGLCDKPALVVAIYIHSVSTRFQTRVPASQSTQNTIITNKFSGRMRARMILVY